MIRQHHKYEEAVVGVFFGGRSLRTGRIRNFQVEASEARSIDNFGSQEHILKELIEAIERVFVPGVVGIGIGVPSLVDTQRGIVYRVQNIPSWREVHLRELLSERFGVEIYVNNDANCFAVGEKHFGHGREYRHIVGVLAGTGFGAGVVVDNNLYTGRNCGAGEIGSWPYREHDFEYYCSAKYFDEKYGLKHEMLHERAEKGDKIALAIFEQYGVDMANAYRSILYAYDPELIVLGGRVSRSYAFFEKSLLKTLRSFPYQHVISNLMLAVSTDEDIAVKGAAALYFDALY